MATVPRICRSGAYCGANAAVANAAPPPCDWPMMIVFFDSSGCAACTARTLSSTL